MAKAKARKTQLKEELEVIRMQDKYRKAAKKQYLRTDDIEIDDDAAVSLGDKVALVGEEEDIPGAWVHAWVWIYRDQVK